MKMTSEHMNTMFAPCGMNCKVCYRHCYHKKSCQGCLNQDENKPEHCRKCKIKDCVKSKRVTYCYECRDFPCKQIVNLDKSYIKRYQVSLIENSEYVKNNNLLQFMDEQKKKYTCIRCGGVISIHDKECSECQLKING